MARSSMSVACERHKRFQALFFACTVQVASGCSKGERNARATGNLSPSSR
jgi:hypothetical protein